MPRLTKKLIDRTAPPAMGQVFVRDTELKGFALRVTAGSKVFVFEKKINGRVRRMTLGAYGVLTVEQARQEALQHAGAVARGDDPAQARQDRIHGLTFGQLRDLYLERHARPKKRPGSLYGDECAFRKHLKPWEGRKLTAITTEDVIKLHTAIGRTHPTQGNRTLALLRHMFNLAKRWKVFQGENPAHGIERFRETSRQRFVQPDELPRLFQAIRKQRSPYVQAAFLTALFLGARKGEILGMCWEDVDLTRGIWTIPHTKPHRAHTLPLPTPVVKILRRLPRLKDNPFVFVSSRRKGRALEDLRGPWMEIQTAAKLPDVRIHDLRRTAASWMVADGTSLPLIGKILNHTEPSTTQVYARLQIDPIKDVLEANAQKMLAVVGSAVRKRSA